MTDPVYFEFGWQTGDQLPIFAQGWQVAQSPVGVICLVHGLGEHSSRYEHVAHTFCHAGYNFLTFDLPGHGKSGGKRGHIPSYPELLKNIDQLLERAGQKFPGLPCFLYGHSWGGNLALNYVLRRQPAIAGAIVTSPWLRLAQPPPKWLAGLVSLTGRVWPGLTRASGLDTSAVSRDPAVVHAYQTDPLNHDRVSMRTFAQSVQAGEWALAHAAQFPVPLLLMHGAADRITSPQASLAFARLAPGCTFKLWDDLFHEPHNEPEQARVLEFIIDWLTNQSPR